MFLNAPRLCFLMLSPNFVRFNFTNMASTKIGLLGYGKMGRAIESIALENHCEILWRISRDNRQLLTPQMLREADVVIEFSRPESAFQNVRFCIENGVPVVSGTTGWQKELPEAEKICMENKGAMLWASNFSIGVNLFFALNRHLAKLMAAQAQYAPDVTEIHHIHKLDAPSGTALTLVNELMAESGGRFQGHVTNGTAEEAGVVPIHAIREGEVPGTHVIRWASEVDEILITHKAHTRMGFALGAIFAARWIVGKNGLFSMSDVLGIV